MVTKQRVRAWLKAAPDEARHSRRHQCPASGPRASHERGEIPVVAHAGRKQTYSIEHHSIRTQSAVGGSCAADSKVDPFPSVAARSGQSYSFPVSAWKSNWPPGANLRNTAQYGATIPVKFLRYFKRRFGFKSPSSHLFHRNFNCLRTGELAPPSPSSQFGARSGSGRAPASNFEPRRPRHPRPSR
jgi:hypothetical protein